MSKKNKKVDETPVDMISYDNQGDTIAPFPAPDKAKKDKAKTSVGFTIIAAILYLLAFLPIVGASLGLAVKTYTLVPYYGIWPFIGTVLVGLGAIIFYVVLLCVCRKNTKSSVRTQTVKVLIAFVCLSTVFGVLVTYVFPDVIAFATQNTLYVEDLVYNGESQAETNAKLERDFIRYEILNGNLGHEFSYYDMSANVKSGGAITDYEVPEIQEAYDKYMTMGATRVKAAIKKMRSDTYKSELYDCIYNNYVLPDFDYAFNYSIEDDEVVVVERQSFTLACVDYIYKNSDYEKYIVEGFNNPEIKRLFDRNYESMNQDGYLTFDDPLLLYAQLDGRMTIPIVLRLILDEPWNYTQPTYDDSGNKIYNDDGNYLYEIYDPVCRDKFDALGCSYDYETRDDINNEGQKITRYDDEKNVIKWGYYVNPGDANDKYNGWIVYEDGTVLRPMYWLVLDMLGDPMALVSLDLSGTVGAIVSTVLGIVPDLVDGIGTLLTDNLMDVIEYAAGGASLGIAIYVDDTGTLQISLQPANIKEGMLGYMQATWVQSDNLLFTVINVIGTRNWLVIFGSIGSLLIIAAGVLRECGKKTRERTEIARDRILRDKAAKEAGIEPGDIAPATSADVMQPIE